MAGSNDGTQLFPIGFRIVIPWGQSIPAGWTAVQEVDLMSSMGEFMRFEVIERKH